MNEQTFEEAQDGAERPILSTGEPLSDAVYDALGPPYELDGRWYAAYAHGHNIRLTANQAEILRARREHLARPPLLDFVPGMQVQTAGGDGTEGESPAAVVYGEAERLKTLSELAFGRDIIGLAWEQLKPEERRAIHQLVQIDMLPGWLDSIAAKSFWPEDWRERAEAQDTPRPQLVVNRGDWVIPAGHQNRKARRAAKAKQRREAWQAFKAGRREGMSSDLALKALADPRWMADQIIAQERQHAARQERFERAALMYSGGLVTMPKEQG